MTASTFTASQLAALKAGYSTIGSIDPCAPTYKALIAKLDEMGDDMLRQVAQAGIKFVSSLALNRCIRRGVAL